MAPAPAPASPAARLPLLLLVPEMPLVVVLLPHLPRAVLLPAALLLAVLARLLPLWAKARSRTAPASALLPAQLAPSLPPRLRVLVLSVVFLVSHESLSPLDLSKRCSFANTLLSGALPANMSEVMMNPAA